MAKDPQTKKRKASASEADAEKPTKAKNIEKVSGTPLKKRKATEDASPVQAKKSKAPAESKTSENANGVDKVKDTTNELPAPKVTKDKKAAKTKAVKKSAPEPAKPDGEEKKEDDEIALDDGTDDADLEEDDQTLALIKGFESDDDEEDAESEEVFRDGQEIPKLPADALTMTKKQQKKLKKLAESGASEEPGVVYIGRIPHGFYENEMKAYFKQFGNILRLRVSRNKKTGASKHYAFIEFESGIVAEIVAKTMDSYLMFGHILKVKLVPTAQVHADLFKGANKRFKKVPWNKIEGRKLDQGASEEKWDQRVDREEQRRGEKAEKMKAIGYEFKAPKVKTTKEITKKEKAPLAVADEMQLDEPAAVEATPVVEESSKPAKKGKKAKPAAKDVKSIVASEPIKPEFVEAAQDSEAVLSVDPTIKPKKGKKAKVLKEVAEEDKLEVAATPIIPEEIEAVDAPKPKKGKKAKVVKEIVEVVDEVLPAVIDAPAKLKGKKRKAVAEIEAPETEAVTEVPQKIVKKKTRATLAADSEDLVPEVSAEQVKKAKKSKK